MKTLIVLIGMMGSGKTTVGKILAEALDYTFIDLDNEIEKQEQKSISEIFDYFGENYFRKIENEKIKEYINHTNTVLSLGGGAFQNINTQQLLKNNSIIVYLETNSATIYSRIKNETHRPLFSKKNSIENIDFILEKRKKNYEKAHHKVITDNKSPYEVAQQILGVFK